MQVLDKGFVELIDHMGSDLSIVNAARVSFGKRKESFDEGDAKLVRYLASHEHCSPFRHAYVTLHIKAPIFVLRQWMKHRIASEFNEISGRYVEFQPDYYVPCEFRSQSENVKQGSDGLLDENKSAMARSSYLIACNTSFMHYKHLIDLGVAKEQARCVLPLGLYSEVYWTASLQTIAHFLYLREDSHAQQEIQEYAAAVRRLVEPLFPVSLNALLANS